MIKSMKYSELLFLSTEVVLKIREDFPNIWEDMMIITKKREKLLYLNAAEVIVIKRKPLSEDFKNGKTLKVLIREEYKSLKIKNWREKNNQMIDLEKKVEELNESVFRLDALVDRMINRQ